MEMRRSQWPAAARHYSEAVTLYRTVVEQDSSHLNHRVNLARMLHLLSMTQAKTGLKAIAGESLGESIQILRALASEPPDEPSVLTAMSNSVGHHGTMLLQEDSEQAIAALQESLAICRRLLELEPQVKDRRSNVASALGQLAEGLEHLKLHKEAIRYAQEGELLYQELQQSEPTRQSFRDDRIRILKVLIQANLELQQSQQAVEYAETMVPLIREASTKQGDIDDKSSIATLYFIGDFYIQQRRWDDAISRFDVLRSIGEKILKNNPSDGEMKRNLSIYFDKLAVAYRGKQQPAEALVHAKESLRLREELFELQPADYQIQVDLVYSHSQIVDLQQQLANSAEGIEHLQQCLKLQEQMLKERPTDNELNDAYYSNHLMMSELQLDLGKYADAASMRRLAIDLRKRGLATAEPGKLESLNADIRAVEQMIIRIENAERALDDWENILQVPELELPLILETRMYFLKRQRRFMEGVRTAEKICELPNVPANVLYNAACMFSIAAEETAETTGSEAESLNKKEPANTEALVRESLKAFEKAINAGFTQFEKARTDVNLRPLHNLPEFQRLVMDKVGPQTQP
jgi:tetratricopeptide (TPR) repeat protein